VPTPLLVPDQARLDRLLERAWPSTDPAPRTENQRDRDRVLYSSAFKRLAHVTQVTAPETGLVFHSRLTHSLKVAQFARRLAERLKRTTPSGAAGRIIEALDVDATEAAALAHDIGHPPFGHVAEQELNGLAASFGGFEGNAQSFRILTRLALRSEQHLGLNLTRKTLADVLKYPWLRDEEDAKRSKKWNAYVADGQAFEWVRDGHRGPERSIEAELMDWGDDVTYAVHDMDDFYRAGVVPLDRLCQPGPELEAFQTYIRSHAKERADGLCQGAEHALRQLLAFDIPYAGTAQERINLRATGSGLIGRYIEAPTIENVGETAVIAIDENLRNEVDALKQLIWFYVIERPSLGILQRGQRRVISEIYKIYEEAALRGEWRLFPSLYVERLRTASTDEAKCRAVVDLISSMTEAGALEVYRRMTGMVVASISDPTGRVV
jgi:dGTPase